MVVILYETTTQRCYFTGMVDLVEESVECYLERQRLEKKTDGSETIARIVGMDIEMSVSEVSFRNSYHTTSMIRLTISFTVRNSKSWKKQTVYNSINVILYKLRS